MRPCGRGVGSPLDGIFRHCGVTFGRPGPSVRRQRASSRRLIWLVRIFPYCGAAVRFSVSSDRRWRTAARRLNTEPLTGLIAHGVIAAAVAERPHYLESGPVFVRKLLGQISRLVLGYFILRNSGQWTGCAGQNFMRPCARIAM